MNLIEGALNYFSGKVSDVTHTLRRKYFYLAEVALRKRLPMKVEYKLHLVTEFPYCPSCGEYLHKHSGKFCGECGQRLSW